ncbi:MAG: hypothetical protein DRN33_00565 [Thermoplasmata archaeon]|nr:MAG: hypothetical protein DRN33_00565 [Thermoplasmata archaeon]
MPRYKLVAFDMDGVLVDMKSSWRYIHECFGTDNSETRKAYLNGEISSQEYMDRDIAMWKSIGKTVHDIEAVFENVPFMKGIGECMSTLRDEGIITAIVSGGIGILAKRIAQEVGIEHVLANDIKGNMEGGILNVSPRNKGIPLKKLARDLGIRKENIASVGNSKYDVKMFMESGMGIAFNPCDDAVIANADAVIKEKDLSLILPYILE